MDWLDVRITEKLTTDLFGEEVVRTVQFRYVVENNCWHPGLYGRVHYEQNYAPFKNDNTWQTPAAQDWRPLITACQASDRIHHSEPSLVAVADSQTAKRLCRDCLKKIHRLRDELLQKSPEYRRHQMLEKMLRHADETTRQQLQVESPDLAEAMLKHLRDNGPEESFQLACLADAFGVPD